MECGFPVKIFADSDIGEFCLEYVGSYEQKFGTIVFWFLPETVEVFGISFDYQQLENPRLLSEATQKTGWHYFLDNSQ